jgi:hypothetical protein
MRKSSCSSNYELEMFVIYENAQDYPAKFVVRRFVIENDMAIPTNLHWIGETLEEARKSLPPHCARLERDTNDEPQIVESWI